MRERSEFNSILPKAALLASVLMVSMTFSIAVSMTARAEDPPVSLEQPAETKPVIEAPASVSATSANDSSVINWVWGLPAGGLNPGAVEGEPGERGTDITHFQYQLFKNDASISDFIKVEATVVSADMEVISGGTYVLKVWSVTRDGEFSAPVEGSFEFTASTVKPELPPIKEETIPKPLNPLPAVTKPAASETKTSQPVNGRTYYIGDGRELATASPSVLAATDTNAAPPLSTPAVVKASTQGWVIYGMAWYIWLLIAAGMFAAGKGVVAYVKRR